MPLVSMIEKFMYLSNVYASTLIQTFGHSADELIRTRPELR